MAESPEEQAQTDELHPVASSMVSEVGYEEEEIVVIFNNGGSYTYPAPRSTYLELLNAPSVGKFLWETGVLSK